MGRGLSEQQLAILRLADKRRREQELPVVRWGVAVIRDLPEPLAKLWAERLRKVYRNFVPENRNDLYFKDELRVEDHSDVERLVHELFLPTGEHKKVREAYDDEARSDILEAKFFVGSECNYGSSVIGLAVEFSIGVEYVTNRKLKDAGFEKLPADGYVMPSTWDGRWVVRYPYRDCGSYAEAKALRDSLAPVLGPERVAVVRDTPERWKAHVPISALMADLCGLRQYVINSDTRIDGGCHFDHSRLPAQEYNQARATITRACARLESRNLVVRNWSRKINENASISITDDGVAAIAGLDDA